MTSVAQTEAGILRRMSRDGVGRLDAVLREYSHWFPESVYPKLHDGTLVRTGPNHYYRINDPDALADRLVRETENGETLNGFYSGSKEEVQQLVCAHGKDEAGRCIAPFSAVVDARRGTCLAIAISEQLLNQQRGWDSQLVIAYGQANTCIPDTRKWEYHAFNILPKLEILDDVSIGDVGHDGHFFFLKNTPVVQELDLRPGVLLCPGRRDRRKYFLPLELSYLKEYLIRELK